MAYGVSQAYNSLLVTKRERTEGFMRALCTFYFFEVCEYTLNGIFPFYCANVMASLYVHICIYKSTPCPCTKSISVWMWIIPSLGVLHPTELTIVQAEEMPTHRWGVRWCHLRALI